MTKKLDPHKHKLFRIWWPEVKKGIRRDRYAGRWEYRAQLNYERFRLLRRIELGLVR